MARKKKDEEETKEETKDVATEETKEEKKGKEKKSKEKKGKEKKGKEEEVKEEKGKEKTPEIVVSPELTKVEATPMPESTPVTETPEKIAEPAPVKETSEKIAESSPAAPKEEKESEAVGEERRAPETRPRGDMRPGRGARRDRRDRDEEIPELHDNFKPEIVTGTGILLFEKWPTDVTIKDKGLQRYLNLRDTGVPHFHGVYTRKRFWKHKQSIVERLANRMMTPGTIRARIKGKRTSYRAGKKQHAINVVRRAFELINLKSGENPVQMLVQAIENAAPREDTTRISMGGITYQSSVDVAPARRVDGAIHLLSLGASRRSHNSPLTIEECLCEEILAASKGDSASFAIARKEEKERIAFSAR